MPVYKATLTHVRPGAAGAATEGTTWQHVSLLTKSFFNFASRNLAMGENEEFLFDFHSFQIKILFEFYTFNFVTF